MKKRGTDNRQKKGTDRKEKEIEGNTGRSKTERQRERIRESELYYNTFITLMQLSGIVTCFYNPHFVFAGLHLLSICCLGSRA